MIWCLFGVWDWADRVRRERRNKFMPNGNMRTHSMFHLLGGCMVVVFLSVLAGCAGVGMWESGNGSGPRASTSASAAAAQPSPGKSVSAQAGAGSPADAKEELAESVQIFRGW